MLTGKAKLAGIIGDPVSHSMSPALHGFWLDQYKIDGVMVPLPTKAENFTKVIDGLRHAGFKGVNVTIPHKEAAHALAHTLDGAAKISGAVNLLVFREDGRIDGFNTDAFGLSESLERSLGTDALKKKKAVLLGAGGAARAGVLALDMPLGVSNIHILNRNLQRAKALAESLLPHVKAKLIPGTLEDWPAVGRDADLLLNTTSAGMAGNSPLQIDLGVLPKSAAVCDIVYNPLETELLKNAAARGHRTVDGLGMLMHQAVFSFSSFFGSVPGVTPELRAALEKMLRAREQ
jgi:shikimate dehydrogenase